MRCKNFRKDIVLYFSDELSRERIPSVERHMDECSGCSRFASGIRDALGAVRAVPRPDYEIDLWPRVKEKISRKRTFFPGWILVPAMAALIIGTVFTKSVFHPGLKINPADMEIVNELEFLVDYELWEDLEALENVELAS